VRTKKLSEFYALPRESDPLLRAMVRECRHEFQGNRLRLMHEDPGAVEYLQECLEILREIAQQCFGQTIAVEVVHVPLAEPTAETSSSADNHRGPQQEKDAGSAGTDSDEAPHEAKPPSRLPRPPEPHWEAIPSVLLALRRWVNWRYELHDERYTKVRYQPDGRNASSTDPNTCSSFEADERSSP
jgi:hypothetical protein